MERQYNKNLKVNNYQPGQKVWLKVKYYKTGESKKLARRKSGPWTINEKLENGLNFRITKDSSNKKLIVHHDRLIPLKPEIAAGERNIVISCETSESDNEPLVRNELSDTDSENDNNINKWMKIVDIHYELELHVILWALFHGKPYDYSFLRAPIKGRSNAVLINQ